MITRVRLECTGPSAKIVRQELIEWVAEIREWTGGEYTEEEPGIQIQQTAKADRYWGRLTVRREE